MKKSTFLLVALLLISSAILYAQKVEGRFGYSDVTSYQRNHDLTRFAYGKPDTKTTLENVSGYNIGSSEHIIGMKDRYENHGTDESVQYLLAWDGWAEDLTIITLGLCLVGIIIVAIAS